MEIDLEQLRELMQALKDHELSELRISKGDERIVLRRGGAPLVHAPAASHPVAVPASALAPAPAERAAAAEDADVVYITSPFVGTFYRAASPTSSNFVEAGAQIAPGNVLCIVEAMKLMNEIESEIAGTILEILVENGKPVEYGDRLFKVRKH
jgi:acetyl-CoA carboxylase biotin carboxyl carrier protein